MQLDELRNELTTLADEMEPFEGNVGALHRRERRRRIIGSSIAAVLVVVVGVAALVIARHDTTGHVQVLGQGAKEVSTAQIGHVDVIVVPASADVQQILDASPQVSHYARLARGVRLIGSGELTLTQQRVAAPLSALESSDGFEVQAVAPGSNLQSVLAAAVAGKATAYDVAQALGIDFEVFLKVQATRVQLDHVRNLLEADPTVETAREVTKADAYETFKQDFANQPELVKGTKASDLPASFRVTLHPGSSIDAAVDRYKKTDGVDSVISRPRALLTPLTPPYLARLPKTPSACPAHESPTTIADRPTQP